jgi:hypothetical protein
MSRHHRNTTPDVPSADVGAALRAALPEPPTDDVDWGGLHARISAAAAPLLEERLAQHANPRRALARSWWQPLAGWSPFGIPVAAAASILLMLAAGVLRTGAQAETEFVASPFHTLEEELASGVSGGLRPLLAGVGSEAMLDVALFFDGEDW